jgi:hypothetical protein
VGSKKYSILHVCFFTAIHLRPNHQSLSHALFLSLSLSPMFPLSRITICLIFPSIMPSVCQYLSSNFITHKMAFFKASSVIPALAYSIVFPICCSWYIVSFSLTPTLTCSHYQLWIEVAVVWWDINNINPLKPILV